MLRGDYTYKTVGDGVDVGATVYWEEAARSGTAEEPPRPIGQSAVAWWLD